VKRVLLVLMALPGLLGLPATTELRVPTALKALLVPLGPLVLPVRPGGLA
jgi:hypothetical protein